METQGILCTYERRHADVKPAMRRSLHADFVEHSALWLPPTGNLTKPTGNMELEQLEMWVTNGERNTAGLFADDDHRPPDGYAPLTRDGESFFYIRLSHPFNIATNSPQLQYLLSVNSCPSESISQCLDSVTRTILSNNDEYMDDLDDPDADEYLLDPPKVKPATAMTREMQMQEALGAFDVGNLNKSAMDRVLSDLISLRDTQHTGWRAYPQGRNLALWCVEIFDFEKGTQLEKDMNTLRDRGASGMVHLSMSFPPDYPFKPPFLRVVRPRFAFHTARITVGGSICTQVLTDEGWSPTYDVESLLVSIRAQITDPDAGARIDFTTTADYTESEAREAFRRVAEHHRLEGW